MAQLLAARALALANLGLFQQANLCAQEVLLMDPNCVKAILIKADALYNTCEFEKAMALFCHGQRVAPGFASFKDGLEKCRKTIQGTLDRCCAESWMMA